MSSLRADGAADDAPHTPDDHVVPSSILLDMVDANASASLSGVCADTDKGKSTIGLSIDCEHNGEAYNIMTHVVGMTKARIPATSVPLARDPPEDDGSSGSSCLGPPFDASGDSDDAKGGGSERGGPTQVDAPPDKRPRTDPEGATSAQTGQRGPARV